LFVNTITLLSITNPCTVGLLINQTNECHKKTKVYQSGLTLLKDLDDELKCIYLWRAGLDIGMKIKDEDTICFHHEKVFGQYFKGLINNTKCWDIFGNHSKSKKKPKGMHEITLHQACYLKQNKITSIDCVPGYRLCRNCWKQLKDHMNTAPQQSSSLVETVTSDSSAAETVTSDSCSENLNKSIKKRQSQKRTNQVLAIIGESPLKLHAKNKRQKVAYTKKKIETASKNLAQNLSMAAGMDNSYLTNSENETDEEQQTNNFKKAEDLDALMQQLQKKFETATREDKMKILTLKPDSWSYTKTAQFFGTSLYLIQQALKLKQEKGVLAQPNPIKSKNKLSEDLKQKVIDFYLNDEHSFSRIIPGLKDKVSLSKNVYAQKRLLLCNIDELYALFKSENPNVAISRSMFFSLRPKQCVTVSAPGAHSVCVCTHHQNVNLMAKSSMTGKDYKEFMAMIVCDVQSKDCMLHGCPSCPGVSVIEDYLTNFYETNHIENLTYQQWVSTDKTSVTLHTATAEEFAQGLAAAVNKLKRHSYIAKAQSYHLKQHKENLKPNEAIVLLDFSENYSFVIQDEAQSYHWNNTQCSLHPALVYYKPTSTSQLCHKNFCVVSDDKDHDVAFVHEVQNFICNKVSSGLDNSPNAITHVTYYSDGCAAQYKNYKNLMNLCAHKTDFGLSASWVFFATSHGKSPCDGIGGTVKRLVRRESLQRPINNQILNEQMFFEFCSENIPGIIFQYISSYDINLTRQKLKPRFAQGCTIPGTRSYHFYEPLSDNKIGCKYVCSDVTFSAKFDFSPITYQNIKYMEFEACWYNFHWWIGLILKLDENQLEADIKFMCPHGPSPSFYWPEQDDICTIPYNQIICSIDAPSTSSSGRTYTLSKKSLKKLQQITLK